MISEYYYDPETFDSLLDICYENGYKDAVESFSEGHDDNYIMKFFKDALPCVYEEIKSSWIGKTAILAGDNIYFSCSLKELAKLFKENGGCAGIGFVIKRMYINIYSLNYKPVNHNSFKSTYSSL